MPTPRCRILSQKEMQDARQTIAFCYLCGKDLPPRGEPGRRKQLIGEHVIPRTLLGNAPESQAEAWAVVLDVHRACEESTKQRADHWLKLLQDMHVKPASEWAKPGHVRDMPIRPSLLIHPQTGTAVTTFTGLGDLFAGVWRWIRGLHAALYREFLLPDVWHFSYPPVPACSSQESGPTIEDTETQSHLIRSSIGLAESLGKWDGITAWGGAARYRCTWWQCAALKGKPNWICFWTLSFPRLEEWSRQVLPRGSERPWHGNYACAERPNHVAWLQSEDFPEESGSGGQL